METPRKFIIPELSIISTDEDPSLRIESYAILNLRGVSTKLYFICLFVPVIRSVAKVQFSVNRFGYGGIRSVSA